jgi:hypothetical protein
VIPLQDLKLHLKVDADVTADDTLIVAMEEAAVAYLQNETGRYFGESGEITEILSANGWASIWLQAAPITDDEDYFPFLLERRSTPSGDWEVVDSTDYEVDGYRLYPLSYWTPARRTLRATYYSSAYAEGAEPPDVQQAVRELVTRMYKYRLPFVEGSVLADLPGSVADVIRAHKVVVF